MAHHWYALYLLGVGQPERALAENDIARQLNPFSVPVNNARAIILIGLRRYEDALAQTAKLREIEDVYTAHEMAGSVYRLQKRYAEAIAEWQRGAELRGDAQRLRDQTAISNAYKVGGYEAAVREMVKTRQANPSYEPYEIALAYLEAGNKDAALRFLEKASVNTGFGVLLMKTAPELDPVRGDPRFEQMVAKMKD